MSYVGHPGNPAMNAPHRLSEPPPFALPRNRVSMHDAHTGSTRIFPPSVRTACMTLALLLGLHVSLAIADDHPDTGDPTPLTRAELDAHPERLPTGSCVCLDDPATGNFTKNCLVQHREGETTPRFFCRDRGGLMTHRAVPSSWLIVPSSHSDCHPCDQPPPLNIPDVPRD